MYWSHWSRRNNIVMKSGRLLRFTAATQLLTPAIVNEKIWLKLIPREQPTLEVSDSLIPEDQLRYNNTEIMSGILTFKAAVQHLTPAFVIIKLQFKIDPSRTTRPKWKRENYILGFIEVNHIHFKVYNLYLQELLNVNSALGVGAT